jgi:hypothetical protein
MTRSFGPATLLTNLLAVRMPIIGTLQDRQQRLRMRLLNEKRCKELSRHVDEKRTKRPSNVSCSPGSSVHSSLGKSSWLKINRVHPSLGSIKRQGRRFAMDRIQQCKSTTTRICAMHNKNHPDTDPWNSQCTFSMALSTLAEDGTMGTLSMDNNRTRSVMNSIELLIMDSFPDSRCKQTKTASLALDITGKPLIILRKKTDVTNDEIARFQRSH